MSPQCGTVGSRSPILLGHVTFPQTPVPHKAAEPAHVSNLHRIATSPTQYDNVGTDWLDEGGRDTPWRVFFTKVLSTALGDLAGKSVLDVGCGTGWLSDLVRRLGAGSYLGLEPSRRNYHEAVARYADARFVNVAFETFSTARRFDVICCVMSTEHMTSLDLSLAKSREHLNPDGRVVIISGDPDAYVTDRFGYAINIEPISNDEVVVQTLRPVGVDTVDIIRAPSLFVSTAARHGLEAHLVQPLEATDELIAMAPQYECFRRRAMFQLMIFGHSGELCQASA